MKIFRSCLSVWGALFAGSCLVRSLHQSIHPSCKYEKHIPAGSFKRLRDMRLSFDGLQHMVLHLAECLSVQPLVAISFAEVPLPKKL